MKRKAIVVSAYDIENLPTLTRDLTKLEVATKGSWSGYDLDGTLAFYDKWRGIEHIGVPVPKILIHLKKALMRGERCKIFTARVHEGPRAIPPILEWLTTQGLPALEVTNIKDFEMVMLYDDRCRQVEPNTGRFMDGKD